MEPVTVYLQSYDRYVEILEYRLPYGRFAPVSRERLAALGAELAFGAFSRSEDGQVTGVFASPDGPVLFVNARWVLGRFGRTFAVVTPGTRPSEQRFALTHTGEDGRLVAFDVFYEQRLGIGANPYDNEREDVDLFAMIAAGVKSEAFFRAYTR